MAKNDWIVAGLNNPDFTPYDFSTIAELNLNNTQMLSAEEYMKSDFIKNHDMFKDDSGNFSEDKFRQYHQKRLEEFGEFQEQEFPKGPQLDMFDTDRTKESRVKDIRFDLGRHVNPDRQAVGIEGVRVWSDPTQTKSEIAQSQNIWDTKNNKFKDYSSNDKALSKGLFDWLGQVFSDPLVMAQWEEDGEHIDPITGLTTKHSKGDYKLNDKGTYYYETLGDRSPIGKEVLSVFDTLTVDGEGINKYDFFDSDDVKKSVTGVIAKNVAALLPLFTPVGGVYSALMVAKEFSKAMPMLYGWMTSLSDRQEAPKWINTVAAYSTKYSGGTSQYAKENTFSFENFGNLIADVALQWGQQKAIANGINKLRGANTYVDDAMKSAKSLYDTKKATLGESEELWQACLNKYLPEAQKMATQAGKLGRDASLAYMAVVSNSDLYNEMRNMGLTNSEAAAISLGSTLGMFGLNKYTGLGEIFFDDATDDSVKLARKAIKAEMKNAEEMFKKIKGSDMPQPNKMLKFIQTASEKTREVFDKFGEGLKYHTLNFAGKAAGEGLEEVSEELISDVAKEIYQLAGQFGFDTTLKDIGAWDNALERYTMSFLGGALGGGIFYGKEALIDGKSYKRDSKNWEMATLIRNGHANELRAEIEKLKKEGGIGSTTLSASKYGTNEKGEKVWLTTDKKEDSQNDAMANAMLDKVNALEAIINNNRIGLSDEQLFENMVLTEKRYKRYEKIAPLTNYYQDFSTIVNDLIAAELDLNKASETVEGTVNGTPRTDVKLTAEQEAKRQQQLLPLQQRVEELRKKKDEFLAGDTSLEYTRKLNFLIDPMLHSQFLSIDQGQFFREKYGDRRLEELTPEEIIQFQLDWNKKVEDTLKMKDEVNAAWERYKEIEALMIPELDALGQMTPEYKAFAQKTEQLFAGVLDTDKLFASYLTYDSKLEGEDDELYNARNTKLVIDGVEESDVDFALRRLNRRKAIDAYNTQKDQEWVDKVNEHLSKVGYKVDPFTFRFLRRSLPRRQKDIVERKIANSILSPNVRQIFKRLTPTLDNVDEIKQLLRDSAYEQSKSEIKSVLRKISELELTDADGDLIDLNEYVVTEPDGELTLKEIAENPSLLDLQNPELISYLSTLAPILGDDITLSEVIQNGETLLDNNAAIDAYVNDAVSAQENQLEAILADIVANPIYSLADSVKSTVRNPIGELIKSLAAKRGDDIPNVDEVLDLIQDDFENIEAAGQLILDDTQMSNLIKVRDYMKLIGGFMYAAASNPNPNNPVGHNQVINAFAKTHKDKLLKEWAPLPEIESDYYLLYDQAMNQYVAEINDWINLSNNNNVNKIRKFVLTDRAFNVALYDALKSRDLKIKLGDVEFDLLEGLTEDTEEPEIKLFNAEQTLHRNFQIALQKSGLTVSDFLQKTGLLEKLVPSTSNIAKQRVASLTDTLKKENLTDFDLIQYFAQVLTLNPSEFYSELKSKIKKNEDVAPITAQEYSTKLAKAIANKQYRDIMKFAYEKSGSKLPFLGNTLIIPGVAGAGKTAVVLSSVNDPNEDVIVAGPTTTQATKLQRSLGRTESYTFDQVLEMILGKEQLTAIRTEFGKVKNGKTIEKFDCEYFTVEPVNGVAVVKLKRDAIKFNKLAKTPKKLFLDEATHLGALEIQILDAFAESIGAVNYLAGDPNQRGAFSAKASTGNLQEDQVFASRAPKLSISLRDNNLQKYINQENVRALLDTVNDSVLDLSEEDLQQFWPRALNTLSKFNFRVYDHDELNGDLITSDLSPELLKKLKGTITETIKGEKKSREKTIGFIGDSNSPYLQKLREAGLNPTVLSMEQMQGEEFDFVVIDRNWEPPKGIWIQEFLRDLYTTMTRARTASIFIDNGLSTIIGKNIKSDNKSKAPSILEGVRELREKKLSILDRFKLDLEEIKAQKEPKTVTKTLELIDGPIRANVLARDPKLVGTGFKVSGVVSGLLPNNAKFKEGDLLATLTLEDGTKVQLTALAKGTIKEVHVGEGETVKDTVNLYDLEFDEPVTDINKVLKVESIEVVPEGAATGNPEEDFIDPDKKNIDPDVQQAINEMPQEDEAIVEETKPDHFAKDGEQVVETFTDVTILGSEDLGKQKRIIKYNGQDIEVEMPVWLIRRPQQGPLRNLQALFTTKDKTERELITYDDKMEAQKALFDLKSCIIYQHSYEELPQVIKQRIRKQDWEQGKLEIEIRTPEVTDTTHLNAKYTKAGFEYGDKKYIANIVFTVKLKDGSEAKFDISGLPSIDSFHANLQTIKANLRTRISKATGEEKTKLQEKLDNMDATFAHYESLLKGWIEQFESGTFKPITLDASTITFNKTTWFQDLQKSEREAGLQLGGKLNPITGESVYNRRIHRSETVIERSRDSLKLRHPELVFSPIYTYAKDPRLFESSDYTLKGKAVILVSSDTTLRPDQLLEIYMNQKSNPEANTARVRMLILDNYGMTFAQLTDTGFINAFQHGNEERKPFRQNFTGMRMFTALWNWRASLIKFNEALDRWMIDHGYNKTQVETLTKIDQLRYDASQATTTSERANLEAEANALLQSSGLTEEDVKALSDFNTKGLVDIPIFRLGFSKNGNGFYVRGNVDVSGSSVYNKSKVNLLAITPDKAKQFEFLIDRVLSGIEYSDKFGDESLGLRLLHDDGSSWDKDEFIDLSPGSEHRRTLSKLMSYQDKAIVLKANGQNVRYEGGSQWSLIPAMVSNIVRTVTYFQRNPDEITHGVQFATLVIPTEGEEKRLFKTQIDEIFSDGYLKTGDDSSLFDLMNLIFHGTVQDIHKKLKKGDQLLQVEDSYFKHGFFISPDVSRKKARHGDSEIAAIKDVNGDVVFYPIETSEELFTVDTDVRTAGLGLRINEIFKNVQEEEKKIEEEVKEDPIEKFKREYPELSAIIEAGIDARQDFEYSLDSEQEAVDWRNESNIRNIHSAIDSENNAVLDFPYKVTSMGGHITTMTLRDYVTKTIGSDSIDIEFRDGLIIKSNGTEYKVNDDFTITKLGAPATSSKYDQKLANGKTVKDMVLSMLIDDQVRQSLLEDTSEEAIGELHRGLKNLFKTTTSEDELSRILCNLGSGDTNEDSAWNALVVFLGMHEDGVYKELNDILINC
jgi:hypothetical protein